MTIEKILLEFLPTANNILPALKKINTEFGFISQKDSGMVADYFSVSESRVYEVTSFYDLINVKKQRTLRVQVCFSTYCVLSDSSRIISEIEKILRIKVGDENHPFFKLEKVVCLGRCGEGPIVIVNGKVYEKMTVEGVYAILEEYL